METASTSVEIGLNAAIVAIDAGLPNILCVTGSSQQTLASLPFGPFDPAQHRTLELGLRSWVTRQTRLRLGYVEQLYTFGDRGRLRATSDTAPHVVSVGYLALTRMGENTIAMDEASWLNWYRFLPWEDWRTGRPALLDDELLPQLNQWAAEQGPDTSSLGKADRPTRIASAFGSDTMGWDEERVLERYELLYEAGLLQEAVADGRFETMRTDAVASTAMQHDHRRILATAIARLRAKLKYRPVVFELMPLEFTLTELQHTVEAISGRHLHKQNFRRLVESNHLVEPTGAVKPQTGGRPAKLFRYREAIQQELPSPGLRFGR